MTDHITRLKEALEAGPTPGPWNMATDWGRGAVYADNGKRVVCTGNQNNVKRYQSDDWSGSDWIDAKFIAAANPAAIRELLERLEQAEKDVRRWRHMRDNGVILDGHDFISYGETADHRVDAAIASQEGGKDA